MILGYLTNESKRFHIYVANRVHTVRQITGNHNWLYVPTAINPADLASRGASIQELQKKNWFCGPDFLWEPSLESHMKKGTVSAEVADDDPEVKTVRAHATTTKEDKSWIEITAKRVSSWKKLVKTIAICLQIVKNKTFKGAANCLNQQKQAEEKVLKLCQKDRFDMEVQALLANRPIPRRSSVLKLHPFLDAKGLLHVGGRLNASLALSFEEKHPLIIHKETSISKLAQHFHEGVHHQGQTRTLGALREAGFWITGASKVIRDIIHKCVTCRKLNGNVRRAKVRPVNCHLNSQGNMTRPSTTLERPIQKLVLLLPVEDNDN